MKQEQDAIDAAKEREHELQRLIEKREFARRKLPEKRKKRHRRPKKVIDIKVEREKLGLDYYGLVSKLRRRYLKD